MVGEFTKTLIQQKEKDLKRFILGLVLLLVMMPMMHTPVRGSLEQVATVTTCRLYLNGETISCNGFNIADNNYYRLRDVSASFTGTSSQFDVQWNNVSREIEIDTGIAYTALEGQTVPQYSSQYTYSALPSVSEVLVDGQYESITAYNIDGYNYFKLRDLGNLVDFGVAWDGSTNSIFLDAEVMENTYPADAAGEVAVNILAAFADRWEKTLLAT